MHFEPTEMHLESLELNFEPLWGGWEALRQGLARLAKPLESSQGLGGTGAEFRVSKKETFARVE